MLFLTNITYFEGNSPVLRAFFARFLCQNITEDFFLVCGMLFTLEFEFKVNLQSVKNGSALAS